MDISTLTSLKNSLSNFLNLNTELGTSNRGLSLDDGSLKDFLNIQANVKGEMLPPTPVSNDTTEAILNKSEANTLEVTALSNKINKTAALQYYQVFMGAYLAEVGSDAEWRLGRVTEDWTDPESQYTDTPLSLRLKVDYTNKGNFTGTQSEYYINYLFPPFSNSVFGTVEEDKYTLTRKWDNTYQRWVTLGKDETAELATFNPTKLQVINAMRPPTRRTPGYKALTDNINLIQKVYENITGIVSTYLTDWDISLYIQENITEDIDKDVGVLTLLHRIIQDNPSGYKDSRAYAYGLLPAATSKYNYIEGDPLPNNAVLDPTAYPLSMYWSPYKSKNRGDGLCDHFDLALEGTEPTAETLKNFGFKATSFDTMSTREKIKYYDYLGAAYSGWYSWENMKNYQAVYSTYEDYVTGLDMLYLSEKKDPNKTWKSAIRSVIRTLYKMDENLGEYADLWVEITTGTAVLSKRYLGLPKGQHKCWTHSYYFRSPTTGSGKCLFKVKWLITGCYVVTDGDGKLFEGIQNLDDDEKEFASSKLNGFDNFEWMYSWIPIFQMRDKFVTAEKASNGMNPPMDTKKYDYLFEKEETVSTGDTDTLKSSAGAGPQYANHTGVSQWNPFLYGGPHGRSLSPKTIQGYFEADNVLLRDIPRSEGISNKSDLNFNNLNTADGNDIYFAGGIEDDLPPTDEEGPMIPNLSPYRTPIKTLSILKNGMSDSRVELRKTDISITTSFPVRKRQAATFFFFNKRTVYDKAFIVWGSKPSVITYADDSTYAEGEFETRTGIFVKASEATEKCTKNRAQNYKKYDSKKSTDIASMPWFPEGAYLWNFYFRYNTSKDYYYIDSSKPIYRKAQVASIGEGIRSPSDNIYGTGNGPYASKMVDYTGNCYELVHVQTGGYLKGTYTDTSFEEVGLTTCFSNFTQPWTLEEILTFDSGVYDINVGANAYGIGNNIFASALLKSIFTYTQPAASVAYKLNFAEASAFNAFKDAIGANSTNYEFKRWSECFFFVGGSATNKPLMMVQLPVRFSNQPYSRRRTRQVPKCGGGYVTEEYWESVQEDYIEVDMKSNKGTNNTKMRINMTGYNAALPEADLNRNLNSVLSEYEPGELRMLTNFAISPLEANLVSLDENGNPVINNAETNSEEIENAATPEDLPPLTINHKVYGYGYLMYLPGIVCANTDPKFNLTEFSKTLRTKGKPVVKAAYKEWLGTIKKYIDITKVPQHEAIIDGEGNPTGEYRDFNLWNYRERIPDLVTAALKGTLLDDTFNFDNASVPYIGKVEKPNANVLLYDEATREKMAQDWADAWEESYPLADQISLKLLFENEGPSETDDMYGKTYYPYVPFYDKDGAEELPLSTTKRIREFLLQYFTTCTFFKSDGYVYLTDMCDPVVNLFANVEYQKSWFKLAKALLGGINGNAIKNIKDYGIEKPILGASDEKSLLYRPFIQNIDFDNFQKDLNDNFEIIEKVIKSIDYSDQPVTAAAVSSFNYIVEKYIQIADIKDLFCGESSRSTLEKITLSLTQYLNILYEYRKFFIYKRCNKMDGTLWAMRALESAAPLIEEETSTEAPIPVEDVKVDGEAKAATNIYYPFQTTLQNSNAAKVDAIINNTSLPEDRFEDFMFKVEYIDDENIIKDFITAYNSSIKKGDYSEIALSDLNSMSNNLILARQYYDSYKANPTANADDLTKAQGYYANAKKISAVSEVAIAELEGIYDIKDPSTGAVTTPGELTTAETALNDAIAANEALTAIKAKISNLEQAKKNYDTYLQDKDTNKAGLDSAKEYYVKAGGAEKVDDVTEAMLKNLNSSISSAKSSLADGIATDATISVLNKTVVDLQAAKKYYDKYIDSDRANNGYLLAAEVQYAGAKGKTPAEEITVTDIMLNGLYDSAEGEGEITATINALNKALSAGDEIDEISTEYNLVYCFYNNKWINAPKNGLYHIRSANYDKAILDYYKKFNLEKAKGNTYTVQDNPYIDKDQKVIKYQENIKWGNKTPVKASIAVPADNHEAWGITDGTIIPVYWGQGFPTSPNATIVFNAASELGDSISNITALNTSSAGLTAKDIACSITDRIDLWVYRIGSENRPEAKLYNNKPYIIDAVASENISTGVDPMLEAIAGPFGYTWYPIVREQENKVVGVLSSLVPSTGV